MKKRTFAFDLDGTLTLYDGKFKGAEVVDEPRMDVVQAIKMLKEQGHTIIIYTTRSNEVVQKWCEEFNIVVDYINENPQYSNGNPGKPVADVYIDDRAYCYTGQSADELVHDLNNFNVFYKK